MTAPLSAREAAELGAAGRKAGTAFAHYLVWLGSRAAESGVQRLYFLSREGAWLARHYGDLQRVHRQGASWPQAVTLAVSRRSTLLPSLEALSPAALAPLPAQYKEVSVRVVLDSLGLDPAAAPPGMAASLPLEESWAASGIGERVLAHPWVQRELPARRAAQRAALLRYLAQKGFPREGTALVADIGWRGTIQDNLARLLPAVRISGLYLALFPALSEPPPNAQKAGFVADPTAPYRLNRRMRFVAPLEFLMSDGTPSTLDYDLVDGEAVPRRDSLIVVEPELPGFRALQSGIEASIQAASELSDPSPELARGLLLRLLERPPPALVAQFFEAWRDDRFGAGVLRRSAPALRPATILRAVVQASARRDLGRQLAESGWPWGLLTRDMRLAAPVLRHLILGLDARL